jgi:signal transduction histidine kinase
MTAWRRWLPQSLFGRLMLVLGSGLLLAQLLGALINLAERDRAVLAATGWQQAQRIAEVVRLLDALAPADRGRIAAVLDVPPLVLTLRAQPQAWGEDERAARSLPFAGVLRGVLPEGRALRVEPMPVDARRPGFDMAAAHRYGHPMMGYGPPMAAMPFGGPAWRAQVQLADGSWAQFDTQLPAADRVVPWRLAASLAVLLTAVLLLSWLAVRWLTRPLHVLAEAADALRRDIHHPPLPEDGPLEIRRAAHAFNSMQAKLAGDLAERTRMLAAMSHDLKTPITRMRLRAELLEDDEQRERFEGDLKEMEAMVADTLDFLRGAAEAGQRRQPLDVLALLESLQSDYEAMGRPLAIEGHAEAPYTGDLSLLRRCLANLVDNAFAYGGGAATLRVDDDPQALTLRVQDRGPGIAPAQLQAVFEPFVRLEASRSRATGGTGLGLGIARNIARLHGGDLVLRNRDGGGLEAVLTLPRQPPAVAVSSSTTIQPAP